MMIVNRMVGAIVFSPTDAASQEAMVLPCDGDVLNIICKRAGSNILYYYYCCSRRVVLPLSVLCALEAVVNFPEAFSRFRKGEDVYER